MARHLATRGLHDQVRLLPDAKVSFTERIHGVQTYSLMRSSSLRFATCMVSPEGACAAYYNYGRFAREKELV